MNFWEHMRLDGYGIYVYTAYAVVFIALFALWLSSWLRIRHHSKKMMQSMRQKKS